MKLQGLTIIFLIIILPISLVLNEYVQANIKTLTNQTSYNTRLMDATYDAVKSFQLNTVNNRFSTVSDSKIRDLEASISTFYNTLATSMNASGYSQADLQNYIPAVVYTLYDGYYIYSKYTNFATNETEYGVKPYIYYSARYVVGNGELYDFVVNYTLDNYISVKGIVQGEYINISGFLINPKKVTDISASDSAGYPTSLRYDGLLIQGENLKENLIIINDKNQAETAREYTYYFYNNNKVYVDQNSDGSLNGKYFVYASNKKMYIEVDPNNLCSTSAVRYYYEAKLFSEKIQNLLGTITAHDAVDGEKQKMTLASETGHSKIFEFNETNDPLLDTSTFNEHRKSIIRNSIETNLAVAISTYKDQTTSSYEFVLPKISEKEWEKVVTNVSVISFMQGIPMGAKFFNNYCIVTNNKNKEYVSKDAVYITTNNNEFHRAGCKDLAERQDSITGGYLGLDFERQKIEIAQGNTVYFYPRKELQCYSCIVNVGKVNNIDDVISGKAKTSNGGDIQRLRTVYLTVLAREKYELYKTTR